MNPPDASRSAAAPTASDISTPEPAEPENDTRNPLWVVAIGMACIFAVFALLIAMG